ncbi:YlxR family protein [Aeromicrobium sp.]|uniref:YlxR family protein n=1 Tax=Aeromicrobium sp. TaxID=1871063 RepID=UPI003D6A7CAD
MLRTCIGCRSRADKTTLVRIVAVRTSTTTVMTPDERGSLPGRGAHLHPDPRCLELARRRRAFGRALRVEGPIDTDLLDAIVGPAAH